MQWYFLMSYKWDVMKIKEQKYMTCVIAVRDERIAAAFPHDFGRQSGTNRAPEAAAQHLTELFVRAE